MAVDEEKSDFSSELRNKTKDVHDKSDRLINLKLVVVLTDTKLYAEAITEFYFVFRTIEECIDRLKEDPRIHQFYIKEMFRKEAFERDLEYFLGSDWSENIRPSIPAQAYCDRLYEIADTNPVLLIAYIHSMYLALLAGGQILKRIIKKTLGLSGELGLSLFEFEDINRKELRRQILSIVDGLNLSRQEKDAIIEEKFRVFDMNNKLARNIKPSWQSYKRLAVISSAVFAAVSFCLYCLLKYFEYL